MDLGLERAGFKVLAGLDFDPNAGHAHRKNFPHARFFEARIGQVDKKCIVDLCAPVPPGQLDLLAGGPPCPPFSKSRFYLKDKPRAMDDPNGWETINGYMEVLAWMRPRAFILENVKGLAYKVHEPALKEIISRANQLGYDVKARVLNAANYGVPQIRERCFVIGIRDGGSFSFPAETHSNDTLGFLPRWVGAGSVLADLDTDENANDEGHFAGGQHHGLLRQVPPGDNYLFFTKERGHPDPKFEWRKRYWSFLLKLSPTLPSWTIQARRSNNMGPFHWRNRILRIGEIKRLQTIPDDFVVSGTIEQQWRQIGNAVPPLLAERVAESVYETLMQDQRTRKVA